MKIKALQDPKEIIFYPKISQFKKKSYICTMIRIEEGWREALAPVFSSPRWQQTAQAIRQEYATTEVYPPAAKIFAAFDLCPFAEVKVVIIGQDPYHGPGQANGLAFSVNDGIAIPPSLQNIYREIEQSTGTKMPPSGNLERWARQGVLLLNNSLSVRARQAGSHASMGWNYLTDEAIRTLAAQRKGLVFMLWGSHAGSKAALINQADHLVLRAPHPSPLSCWRGFFGCNHFVLANNYLTQQGKEPIRW